MTKQNIATKINELPDEVQREALDYIEFLSKRYGKKEKTSAFKFDWEGGLSGLRSKFTSVELQHKASEWR